MPIHDWTRVDAGIFHHFHQSWIADLARHLNQDQQNLSCYALAAPSANGLNEDDSAREARSYPVGGSQEEAYADRADVLVIRHTNSHRVAAVIEVLSPGNKNSRHALRSIVDKIATLLRGGIHVLLVDLHPPTTHDPHGIHKRIWDEIDARDFHQPPDRRLTVSSYIGGTRPTAFVEPVAVDMALPEMPLFLSDEAYIRVPLEATYQVAWEAVPAYWRAALSGGNGS